MKTEAKILKTLDIMEQRRKEAYVTDSPNTKIFRKAVSYNCFLLILNLEIENEQEKIGEQMHKQNKTPASVHQVFSYPIVRSSNDGWIPEIIQKIF